MKLKIECRRRTLLLAICLMVASLLVGRSHADESAAPFPGKKSDWNGYDKYDFELNGKPALIVVPKSAAPGNPWVWHGEFFGHKPAPDIALLGQGFHIFYARVPDMLGCPAAVEHWNACYKELTTNYGLGRKVGLVGLSRGGLYCYNWAAANPEKVAAIYGDAPVCDFKSWPGGRGKGKGSQRDWRLVLERYGFANDEEALAYNKNPVDNLDALAAADVPLLHVYGDADQVVPWDENTGLLAERYRKLGGRIKLIAKPGVDHHPHGLEDSTPIVEFLAHHGLGTAQDGDGGSRFEVVYPPSQGEGELKYGVTYTVWIPDDVKTIRAVIVHQHGCGGGACRGGQTAAFDLHWQALARKHHCALLGPSYHQPEGADCRLWCDPRNGSRTTFLRALDDLSQASGHAELAHVPWCLWGHSGGAFWSSLMQTSDPQRIVAVWLRSGTAYAAWEKGEIPKPELSAAVFQIPVAFNPGFKEKMHARFNGAWNGAASMYQAYRQQGAPVLFAPDPHTAHECGDSRYLAIRFFDAHLRALGDAATSGPIPRATTQVEFALAAEEFPTLEGVIDGPIKIHPDLLDAWKQYVQTAEVADDSPPAAPYDVRVAALAPSVNEIRWRADADLESGLMQFEILRDGKTIARYPEQPRNPFGKPLFQGMSYHDTPETPLRLMRYVDPDVPSGDEHVYQIVATNGAGLSSPPSAGGSSL